MDETDHVLGKLENLGLEGSFKGGGGGGGGEGVSLGLFVSFK